MKGELFVELLCEELPASMVGPALEGLREGLLGLVSGVEHGAVSTWATPRRLAVAIADLHTAKPVVEKVVTGPPADRAFQNGEPTRAAIGFANPWTSSGLAPLSTSCGGFSTRMTSPRWMPTRALSSTPACSERSASWR